MEYRFAIQASNPRSTKHFDPGDTSLSDAIQTVFPLEAEYALLIWNWTYVPLTYKYDLSVMIEDVLGLVEAMLPESTGKRTIDWPSNTFAARWTVGWDKGITTVDAEWRGVLGETEAVLATKPRVVVPVTEFLDEWKRPLEVMWAGLVEAGYSTENLDGLWRIKHVMDRIQRHGVLYRD